MKRLFTVLIPGAILAAVSLTGCNLFSTGGSSTTTQALTNPNNIARAVQDASAAGGALFLNRNPGYSAELVAAADALVAFSSGNPSTLTGQDLAAILAKTGIRSATQAEISAGLTTALSIFQADFQTQFPSLKPNYAIYLDAVANGLYIAAGKANQAITLPVIAWPPGTQLPETKPITPLIPLGPLPTPTPTP